jgi:DNA-binding NarL/FixJ family response regulator
MSARLLVAEGHWLQRCGLAAVLGAQPGFEVLGLPECSADAVRMTLEMLPDVVVLDLKLPDGGLKALEQIKQRRPEQRVLMTGEVGASDVVREALHAGCDGYVRKDTTEQELLYAVHRVIAGHTYIEAGLARELVLDDPRRKAQATIAPLQRLTERERMVFRLIGAGYTNRAAADRIHLSPKTVEKHRAAVMQKLQLSNALQLRLMAAELASVLGPHAAEIPDDPALP